VSGLTPPPAPSSQQEAQRLARLGIVRLRAENPGPLSLAGTNTWIVGRDPAYAIDPGPALPAHLDRLVELLQQRGGLGGIVLTHDHPDHCEAVQPLRERMPAPLVAARADALRRPGDVRLLDGLAFGPLRALASPGHAVDHFALLFRSACFTGDAVLGEGSVFISPDPAALAGYLRALDRLLTLPLQVLCPGHGSAVWEPRRKLRDYVEHRLHRERRLLAALDAGVRSVEELLDAAWEDVPRAMRPLAAVTLAAHLDKLAEEGRLPEGVQRPAWDAETQRVRE
jgi:glyoxylase-like metal-dependent hydrolase (beta-lactamase superfamily II)